MKIFKNYCDGRMSYNQINYYYLGSSNIYHMVYGTKKKLDQCTYTVKNKNSTFKKYDTLHKVQRNILKSLMDHEYNFIGQIPKAGYLSDSINTAVFDSVNTCIISDEILRQDFDGCMNLYYFFKNKFNVERHSLGIVALI